MERTISEFEIFSVHKVEGDHTIRLDKSYVEPLHQLGRRRTAPAGFEPTSPLQGFLPPPRTVSVTSALKPRSQSGTQPPEPNRRQRRMVHPAAFAP